MNIGKMLENLKDNIPVEYVRSCDTSDGIGYYEEDTESWQYQLYNYITNLQSQLKETETAYLLQKELCNSDSKKLQEIKEYIEDKLKIYPEGLVGKHLGQEFLKDISDLLKGDKE